MKTPVYGRLIMKKFRTVVPLLCAAVCVLLVSGCAFAKMVNTAVTTHQRLEHEDLMKRLNIPPEVLSQIDERHQVVGKEEQLGSLFVICRLKNARHTDRTRIIYYDPAVTYFVSSPGADAESIDVELKKGEDKASFKMANVTYEWKKLELKPVEVAGTPQKK